MFTSLEFFVMLIIYCVGEVQLAGAAEAVQYSVPVEQKTMSRRCSSVIDCPDYLDEVSWNNYQVECCRAQQGPKYHCQQTFVEEHGSHTKVAVVCVWPKTCAAGNYAHVNQSTEGGSKYAVIECLPCTHDRFQPYPQESFKFRIANCTNVFQPCLRENGLVLVSTGNATHDNFCRCWWEGGYKPYSSSSICVSRHGFSQDDCQCEPATCPDGKALSQDFVCVKQPSTTTTSTTTTSPPATTPTTGTNHANGAPITAAIDFLSALTMSAAIIIFI